MVHLCYANKFLRLQNREGGTRIYPLTRDHKPIDELEQKRIIEAGGQIYQTAAPMGHSDKPELIVGPYRVLPGRLSVSRTFGDVEAKMKKYGGNPNVVIATPEIKSFKIGKDHDFIVMGSDGIFDKLSNKDAVQCVWNSVKNEPALNVHQQCGVGIETILKNSLMRRSLDNVTALIIAFANFKKVAFTDKKTLPKAVEEKLKAELGRASAITAAAAQAQKDKMSESITRVSEGMANKFQQQQPMMAARRITPSSTKSVPRKHFDFSKAHVEMMERKGEAK